MPESSHRHTILLFLALGVALLLCICLLWNLAGAAHAAGTARQGETATQMALSQTTDGNNAPAAQPTENPRKSPPPGHFSLTLPPGYTPLLPYPLLFEYSLGKSELAESKSPHAIVASFNAQADTPLDAWRNERKAMDALKELHAQYTIDEQRIYLLAANVEGLAFAARHAADFNALYLEFTKDITPEEWQDLPLGNLANLAVFLDSSNLDVPPVNVRLLAKALRQNQVSRVPAPEFPLPMKDGVLPWALAELSLYLSNNQDVIQHSANRLANGAC
ncbi:MAG: hypothetical protein J6Y80_04545, partial [Victivallales bacterium]|nr:hypothetical protein [Victivallales bacterium]